MPCHHINYDRCWCDWAQSATDLQPEPENLLCGFSHPMKAILGNLESETTEGQVDRIQSIFASSLRENLDGVCRTSDDRLPFTDIRGT